MSHQGPITTHVLDTASGKPASNVLIRLQRCIQENLDSESEWVTLNEVRTNTDGRAPAITAGMQIEPCVYRCIFFTQEYFSAMGTTSFYPRVEVMFRINDENAHYHIPLLLSPYGYSTYRGS
jgi:5-hydroxyisourate hydrolase